MTTDDAALRDRRRIDDIIQHVTSIRAELRVGREEFQADDRAQKVVAYDLMIVGEAAGKISKRTQGANPKVPWRDLVEYRNDLIHDYQTLDVDATWIFVRDVLPGLERRLRSAKIVSSRQ